MKALARLLTSLGITGAMAVGAPAAHAGQPRLVRDLDPAYPSPASLHLDAAVAWGALGNKALFSILPDSNGQPHGVLATDGTAARTVLLTEALPSTQAPGPFHAGSQIFFFAYEGLFRTDGTLAGTFSLSTRAASYSGAALLGERLLFVACAPCGLWISDGSPAGTQPLASLVPAVDSLVPNLVRAAGGRVYFATGGSSLSQSVWSTDGTPAGTRELWQGGQVQAMAAAGDRLIFLTNPSFDRHEVWSVSADHPAAIVATVPERPELQEAGGFVYWTAYDLLRGQELWRTDGTAAGTREVTNLPSPFPFSCPTCGVSLVAVGATAFFVAQDEGGVYRLAVTTGDPSTARTLSSGCNGAACPVLDGSPLLTVGGRVLFQDATSGRHWAWSSDGTPAGTFPLAPPAVGIEQRGFSVAGGRALFTQTNSFGSDAEVWITDGTRAGTTRLLRFAAPSSRANFSAVAVQDRIFFGVPTTEGAELYVSDGSAAGTQPVSFFGRKGASSMPSAVADAGAGVVFSACLGFQMQLWRSGGTSETTAPLGGPVPNAGCSYGSGEPAPVVVAGGHVFAEVSGFGATELWSAPLAGGSVERLSTEQTTNVVAAGARGLFLEYANGAMALWSSDGTLAGTQKVMVLPDGYASDAISALDPTRVLFSAVWSGSLVGAELYVSDGTAGGTQVIAHLPGAMQPALAAGNGVAYFFASAFSGPLELWRTDGTAGGTRKVLGFPAFGVVPHVDMAMLHGILYFSAPDVYPNGALWRSDGTTEGTIRVVGLNGNGGFGPFAGELTAAGDLLYFSQCEPQHGCELWKSDGSAAGTVLLTDVQPGANGSSPHELTAVGDHLFFAVTDSNHGTELWWTDGTTGGTKLFADVAPGPASGGPRDLRQVAGQLYFAADDAIHGEELWSVPPTGVSGCDAGSTSLCLGDGRFEVTAFWRDFDGGTGEGRAAALTGDTGYFWFFSPANVEATLKVLDGRGLNEHFWVFYGALSSVEYALTVRDVDSGAARRYYNSPGALASVGDTDAFGPRGAIGAARRPPAGSPDGAVATVVGSSSVPSAVCVPGPAQLCLNGSRFAVTASWRDFAGRTGSGTAVPLTADTGYFWFFGAENVEVVLKVLDGRSVNGKYWVFYGALSNVEYTLTVTDTATGTVRQYRNPSGRFASVADTSAF